MSQNPPMLGAPGSSLPALDNGTSTHANPGLVSNAGAAPPQLLWDVALPLVVAIAAPLLLKRALESERVRRMFRFPLPKQTPGVPETPEDIDFDSD